jgi:RNA polymerase sigma-70 factor, ECF subfamily
MSIPHVLNVSADLCPLALGGNPIWPAHATFEESLRAHYPEIADLDDNSPLGQVLQRLSRALDAAADTAQGATGFREDLIAAVPHLRRFALSLTRDSVEAEDLVQFTLLKAWEHQGRFVRGTRLIAWLFTILRNGYLNSRMKHRREVPDPDGAYAAKLSRPADQENRLGVRDLQAALDRLDPAQREALLLIAVEDLSYDEAAAIIGCPRGTVKSRVSRARDRLTRELGGA